ncbi:MAG: YlmC/YmxH family sporulation protein [Bacilli bacterium]
MHLSDLQGKDIVNIIDGKRIGNIIDVIINDEGVLSSLVVEHRRFFSLFTRGSEVMIKWQQINKIGEDVILVDLK